MIRRRVVRRGVASVRRPRRARSNIGRSRVHRPVIGLRRKRLRRRSAPRQRSVRPALRLRVRPRLSVRPVLLRRVRTRLQLRCPAVLKFLRTGLILRLRLPGPRFIARRALFGRPRGLRMRLRSRARRGRRTLVMLALCQRDTQPGGARRGSQCCAAPESRLPYAFHVHPNPFGLCCECSTPKNTGTNSYSCRHRARRPAA